MHIANPIYDSVFKYLMEDTESAILLLSGIIEEPIESLDFLPQENTLYLEHRSLTVYRLDFCAKIKTDEGYKQVLIEVQKAKLPSDIMRFRRYLGEQYAKKSNVYAVHDQDTDETQEKPLPIISIYFLGYALKHITTPVIKVNREYFDVVNRQIIHAKEEFIESLSHDSYVIQISQLREQYRTDIERLLAIFDQHRHLVSDEHILDIDEQAYPEKYRSLIRRLQRAVAEPEIRKTMDMEDEILEDLQDMERMIAKKERLIQEKERVIQKKEQVIQEKDQTLWEQARIIAELKRQVQRTDE